MRDRETLLALAERLEATIHEINRHWWNRRPRPSAPDVRATVEALRAKADALSAIPIPAPTARDDVAVEVAIRATGWTDERMVASAKKQAIEGPCADSFLTAHQVTYFMSVLKGVRAALTDHTTKDTPQ